MKNAIDLHDAVLKDIHFDWNERILSCAIFPVSDTLGEACLKFTGVKNLIVPSRLPWGKSSSINEFRMTSNVDGFVFSLEMQSGDTLEVTADDATLIEGDFKIRAQQDQ